MNELGKGTACARFRDCDSVRHVQLELSSSAARSTWFMAASFLLYLEKSTKKTTVSVTMMPLRQANCTSTCEYVEVGEIVNPRAEPTAQSNRLMDATKLFMDRGALV
jgi:hypothetical protein